MLNDAVETKQDATAKRRRAVLIFGGLGLVSGMFSTQVMDVLSEGPWSAPLVGAAFGLAICLALLLTMRPKLLHLAAAFVVIQIAWQAGLNTALQVHDMMRGSPEIDVTNLSWLTVAVPEQPSAARWLHLNTEMLLPGLTGGVVGALGTWLAAAFCVAALRRPGAAIAVILTGALAGLALALDSLALFPIWQTVVAASLALMATTRPEVHRT